MKFCRSPSSPESMLPDRATGSPGHVVVYWREFYPAISCSKHTPKNSCHVIQYREIAQCKLPVGTSIFQLSLLIGTSA